MTRGREGGGKKQGAGQVEYRVRVTRGEWWVRDGGRGASLLRPINRDGVDNVPEGAPRQSLGTVRQHTARPERGGEGE